MKIVYVITGLRVGGAEHVVVNLADAFADRGHDVLIVYMIGAAIILPKNKRVRLIGLNMKSSYDMFTAYLKIRRIFRDSKPDVVHTHMVHANIICRLVRLSTFLPKLISTAHNVNEGGRIRMLAYRFTDRLADISTNVSEEAVAAFVSKNAVKTGRMLTVHNGISMAEFRYIPSRRQDLRRELGLDNTTPVILAVGSLSKQKDYPNLFSALKKLKDLSQKFKLLVAGRGPLREGLEQMTRSLDIEDDVIFLGVRRDIPALMSLADIFVLSSAFEGFGLVVAEAMACERVVVATDCGGVKEVMGEVGFLVAPEDSAALSKSILEALLLEPQIKARIGLAARKRVQDNYSLEAAVEKWHKLYLKNTN